MKPRTRAARLGIVAQHGSRPVRAWVSNGALHFHVLHSRRALEPLPLAEVYAAFRRNAFQTVEVLK